MCVFWLEEVVSNTRACQSSLDVVPPPPNILTTRIKTKLWHTQYAVLLGRKGLLWLATGQW